MNRVLKKGLVFILLTLMGWAIANTTSADLGISKIRIGLKLFRTILAADIKITEKQTDSGKLALALIYKYNQSQADLYAKKLMALGKGNNQGKIKKIPIKVNTINSNELELLENHRYAGIYITEPLNSKAIRYLVQYGVKHQLIVYSPFSGAIEQGITAGLLIEARVKPYINSHTLNASKIQLKPFFLKVSKKYEP